MGNKRLYLIDATALCYRAFYALKELSTSFGQPTNAIYGFINMLNKILKSQRPEYLGACFDVSRDTFRTKKFAEYKIQRPPMPDGLVSQMPLIKQIISAYGITILEKEGFEADDIIATICKKIKTQGLTVTIVSSDKDMLQLVDEHTVVFSPYKDEGIIYDAKMVRERFGTKPQQIPDIIALMGDNVDNIPGVKGIGEKTAVKLIKESGSLENLLGHIDKIKPDGLRTVLSDSVDNIKLSKELALLDSHVDIDFDLAHLRILPPDTKELFRIFKYLEFKKLLKDLPSPCAQGLGLPGPPTQGTDLPGQERIDVPILEDRDLEDFQSIDELFLYGQDSDDLVFYASPVRSKAPDPITASSNGVKANAPPTAGTSNGARGKFFQLKELGRNIKEILSNPGIKKISHDLKKMKVSLAGKNITIEGIYFDTMVAGYLINPSRSGYTLADLALEYLDVSMPAESPDAKRGIHLIFQLKPKLEKLLLDRALSGLFTDIEMPLVEVLAQMELNGIKVDLKLLNELARDLEKRLIKLIDQIYNLSGTQFNINSPKQLSEVLFKKLKLPVLKKGKTGPSTNEEVLRKLAESHKLPYTLLEYRQLMKLKNTYVDTLLELTDPNTGRIHTSFNQTATETGRLSSSNPNLQNLPVRIDFGSRIRQAIVASDKDSELLACDYSQIELRILAHISGDDNLINAFKNNKDIHRATASLIYGIEEKDITDQMREVAKRVNFGIVYGLSAYGLSKDLNIPIDQAQLFIDAYFTRYPGVKDYIEEQIKKAQRDGFVTTILGRRRYIPEINSKNQAIRQFAQRQAINTPIQGSASDLIKLAMVRIHNQIEDNKLKARMLLQVHDELLFDVPVGESYDFTKIVKDRMEHALQLNVPVKVSIKKGKNWLEAEPA